MLAIIHCLVSNMQGVTCMELKCSHSLAVQALSQYYLLLLLPSKVQCINRINGQVKQELAVPPSRALSAGPQTLALASDAAEGSLYLLSGVTTLQCTQHFMHIGL